MVFGVILRLQTTRHEQSSRVNSDAARKLPDDRAHPEDAV
jgi:hypothetical protein